MIGLIALLFSGVGWWLLDKQFRYTFQALGSKV
jgi:hypothetical protein